jgi:FSR family fosmidomycin resistance protein-like MFS transporter
MLVLLPLGFFGLMATPALMASVQEAFPESRALANGTYMALNFGLRSLVVVLVGGLSDWIGMGAAFEVCAMAGLLGLLFVRRLPGKPHTP